MKVLVTGFEPFGGEKVNPALEVVKGLPAEIHGAEVRWLEVPTVFHKSAQVLEEEINRYQPDFVLCIGQAGGRSSLTPERVAINQDDARMAGFMHIPYMMEQVVNRPTTPAMSLVDIRRGIEAAIGAMIEHGDQDLKLVGGETH